MCLGICLNVEEAVLYVCGNRKKANKKQKQKQAY